MNWFANHDEFFVGYISKMPTHTAKKLLWCVIIGALAMASIAIVLILNQREFANTIFHSGEFTTLKGYLYKTPIPRLKVEKQSGIGVSESGQNILLVGEGKFGASATIAGYELQLGNIEGKQIELTGELIQGYGKSLMQISSNHIPEIVSNEVHSGFGFQELGKVTIEGEIVDPKCFFGAMKPGFGKTHLSCAIRCLSGGIPPVIYSTEKEDFYFILDENKQPMPSLLFSIMSDRVKLSGRALQFEDCKILLLNKNDYISDDNIEIIMNIATMEEGITQCISFN